MATKNSEILDAYDPTDVTTVSLFDMGENGNFDVSLLHNISRSLNHFHCHFLPWLMVANPQHLSKRTFVDWIEDLVAIGNVVTQLVLIELTI